MLYYYKNYILEIYNFIINIHMYINYKIKIVCFILHL